MIGSAHGCVLCPVEVKPWEPQSLSRHQHPLPSHPHLHPQPYPYSVSQRSSAVHPLPLNSSPENKFSRHGLSPQRFDSAKPHSGSDAQVEQGVILSKQEHLPRTTFADRSPKRSASSQSQSTPEKIQSPYNTPSKQRSPHKFADQYERLLESRVNEEEDDQSSHFAPSKDGAGQESYRGNFVGQQECQTLPHSQDKIFEPKPALPTTLTGMFSQPQTILDRRYEFDDPSSSLKQSALKYPRESTPTPAISSEDSKCESHSHLGSKSQSPTSASIQNLPQTAVTTREESTQYITSTLPFLRSVKPNRGLPPILDSEWSSKKHHGGKSQTLKKGKQSLDPYMQICGDPKAAKGLKQHSKRKGTKDDALSQQPKASPTASQGTLLGKLSGLEDISNMEALSIEQFDPLSSKARDASVPPYRDTKAADMARCTLQESTPSLPMLSLRASSLEQLTVPPEVDALTTAAAAGDMMKVKALLAEGVDVNAVNSFGRTALQVMTLDNTDLAEVLLRYGADPNVQDISKRAARSTFRTIAHDVAASGYTDMLRCLLRHGANVNLQDRWGNTPLHLAAKGGHLVSVRLLRHGTSLLLPNQKGKSALDLLEEIGDSAAQQWVSLKRRTVSRLQTLCVLRVREGLGSSGLRSWRKQAPDTYLQHQVLLQSRHGNTHHPQASFSSLLSSRNSAASRSLAARDPRDHRGNGNSHLLLPGLLSSKQMTDFLSLRDLIPFKIYPGENTSLEVQNNSSGQSYDECSLGALAPSTEASEAGSLFGANLSSIDANHSADDVSLPSFDQSL